MPRSALSPSRRLGNEGPPAYAPYVPALSVIIASLLMAALPIVTTKGWVPDIPYLMLISWRLLRNDPFPAWWAAPMGLINDVFTGLPIGFSVALWSATMLALDLADRRTMWRDYWTEWVIAAVLITLSQLFLWRVAGWSGASVPVVQMAPATLIALLLFPVTSYLAARLDQWRLIG